MPIIKNALPISSPLRDTSHQTKTYFSSVVVTPKSPSLMTAERDRKMLAGFRSLCTPLLLCTYSNAAQI